MTLSTIDFSCPQCGHAMKLPAALIGKKGKCPKCGMVNEITNPAGTQQTAPVTQQQSTPPQQPDPFQQQIPPQQPAAPQNPLGGIPQAPAGPLGGIPSPPQHFQLPSPHINQAGDVTQTLAEPLNWTQAQPQNYSTVDNRSRQANSFLDSYRNPNQSLANDDIIAAKNSIFANLKVRLLVISGIGILLITIVLVLQMTVFSTKSKLDRLAEKYIDLQLTVLMMEFDETTSREQFEAMQAELEAIEIEKTALLSELSPVEKSRWLLEFAKKRAEKFNLEP